MGIFRGTGGTGDSTTDTTVTTVTQKAAEAASSATSAANSATSAANSASSAATSEANAATSETNAANSATASATSATASETAKTAAQAAQTAAETAETNAETAEANAVTAKNQAVSAKDNAVTAQTAAETAETNAETAYANTLAIYGSTTDVQNAVNSASASATTATTKAAEAASSATDASNYSSSAGTSATQAASSASQAATSANTAGSHATDAETAKDAAETAQAAAEAAEYNINGLYLGSLANDPTLDGNGVAVTTGDLYFNTTAQEVRVYTDGDVWEPVVDLAGDITVNSLTSNNNVVVKGNLEVQGTTITVDSATAQTIDLGDNDKIRLGDSDDLQIYHDGSNSYIKDSGTGFLNIGGYGSVKITNPDGTNVGAVFNTANSVDLNYNGQTKFQTTSTGVDVTGNITVSGTVDGRDVATDGTKLDGIETGATADQTKADIDALAINADQVDGLEASQFLRSDANDTATGNITVNGLLKTNTADSSTDGLNIENTGGAIVNQYFTGSASTDEFVITRSGTGGAEFRINSSGAVRLGHAGNGVKFETTSSGVDITGDLVADGLTVEQSTTDALVSFKNTNTDVGTQTSSGISLYHNGGTGYSKIVSKEIDASDNFADLQFYYAGDTAGAPKLAMAIKAGSTISDGGDVVLYDSAGTSQDFYWDASTSRLGLGTTSPLAPLHVTSSDGAGIRVNRDGNSAFLHLYPAYSSVPTIMGKGTGGLHLGYDSNTAGIRIDTNNNVGIDNTSPGDKLDISTGNINLSNDYSLVWGGGTGRPFITGNKTSNYLRIGTNGTERLRIDSSGRLGIGTTSPSNALHVYHATTNHVAMFESGDFTSEISIKDNTASSYITNEAGKLKLRADVNGEGASSRIQFDVDGSEAARIDSNGRLGIGTTSPIAELTVGSPSSTNVYSVVYGKAVVADTDVTLSTIQAGALDILGTSKAAVGRGPALTFSQNTSQFVDGYDRVIGAIQTELVNSNNLSSNSAMLFYTSDGSTPSTSLTEKMRLDNKGRLGIGTTSPSSLLHLEANNPTLQIKDTSRTSSLFINADYASAGIDAIRSDINNLRLQTDSNTSIQFVPNGSEVMRVVDGKVGIGTTSPAVTLDVYGNIFANSTITANSSEKNGIYFGGLTGGSDTTNANSAIVGFRGGSYTEGELIFKTLGSSTLSERMRIDSSGDVGIGTTNPDAYNGKLVVNGGALVVNNNLPLLYLRDNASGNISDLRFGNSIRFTNGGAAEYARIDSSGNLLVGKTSTSSSTVGFEARSDGFSAVTRDGNTPQIINRLTSDGTIVDFRKDGTTVGSIGAKSGDLYIGTGDVGLKFSDQYDTIHSVRGDTGADLNGAVDLGRSNVRWRNLYLSGGISNPNASGTLTFSTAGSEAARFDTSGNLLVGRTTDSTVDEGVTINPIGIVSTSRNGTSGFFNRNTTDGEIIRFRKDGTTIGSIGTNGGDLYLGTGDTGIRFRDGNNDILPFNTSTNANLDSQVSLGGSAVRFKDLYLSGGVYLGGTGANNLLDDYEEGTWTPSFNGYSTGFTGKYTKIGNIIHCRIERTTSIPSSSITGSVTITGLPFAAQRSYTPLLGHIRGASSTRPFGIIRNSSIGLVTDSVFGSLSYYNETHANWDGSNLTQNGTTAVYIAWEFTYRQG